MTIIGTKEAAEILGCSTNWVRSLARAGDIPSYKNRPGAKNRFYLREEIESLRITGADR